MNHRIEDISRDVEATRHALDVAITRLADRLSPSGLIDEGLGLARRSVYGELVDDMIATVRRNPLPALIAVAAAGWFVLDWQEDRRRRRVAGRPDMARPNGPGASKLNRDS